MQQLQNLQSQLVTSGRGDLAGGDQTIQGNPSPCDRGLCGCEEQRSSADVSHNHKARQLSPVNKRVMCVRVQLLCVQTQQLPPLAKFSGEDLDNEPFKDWVVQFEMIAELCKWRAQLS